MTWRLFRAIETGGVTRNGLADKTWYELRDVPAEASHGHILGMVEWLASKYGAAKAVKPGIEITIMGQYRGERVDR